MTKPLAIIIIVGIALIMASVLAVNHWRVQSELPDIELRLPVDYSAQRSAERQQNVFAQGRRIITDIEPGIAPGDWPHFRGINYDAIYPEPVSISSDWSSHPPEVVWSVAVGEGHAGPAIYQGNVYLLDYDREAREDWLRCLSLETGEDIWGFRYPVTIKRNHGMSRTVPAVNEHYVVTLGPKCHVACFDRVAKTFLWGVDLVEAFGSDIPAWYAGQCPLIYEDMAVIAPGGSQLIVAYDLATGKVLWETPNPRRWAMTYASIMPMTIEGQAMLVYCASGGVVAVDPANGKLLWEYDNWQIKIANIPSPVYLGNGEILLTGGYNAGSKVIQVTREGQQWQVDTKEQMTARVFGTDQHTPIWYENHLYGVGSDKRLVCFEPSGRVLWHSDRDRFGLGPYVMINEQLLVLSDNGMLWHIAAQPEGYEPLGQRQVLNGHDAWAPIAVSGHFILVRDLTQLACVNLNP